MRKNSRLRGQKSRLGALLGRHGRSEFQTGKSMFCVSSGSLGGPLGALLEASLGVLALLGASWAVLEGSSPV